MSQALSTQSDKKTAKSAEAPKVEVKIVEKIVYKELPRRRKLPAERRALAHKFAIAGHEGYIHVGLYDDGTPGEIFIRMNKEGSTLCGVMDTLALSLSMNLQYGVPLEVLCEKLVGARFEPMGMTANAEIPMVKSIMDYMGRWLALKFLTKEKAMQFHNHELVEQAYREGTKSKDAFAMRLTVVDEGASVAGDLFTASEAQAHVETEDARTATKTTETKQVLARQQGFTGSLCGGCGSMRMKRNGSCEVCLDCGATSGCS